MAGSWSWICRIRSHSWPWAFLILAHQLCLPEGAQAKFIFVHHKVSCVYDRFTPPSKFPPPVFGTASQPCEKQVFTSLLSFSLRRTQCREGPGGYRELQIEYESRA
ncbi:unnamed protein product [Eretmochelys imbricata]